ncbi:30S ribosomal protein 2, chloroplastic [Triticum urartu]|uniref:30S ribosomal protein 2, chloroplastic n=1 Tax=Triticum urartu TaxID=4572 RepID=M8ABY7_TRIUA|nr:30S ribosomal protein 2, chloroplastic [Triticum urartu]
MAAAQLLVLHATSADDSGISPSLTLFRLLHHSHQKDHAVPEMVEVLYDRTTGRSRGFAFVTMSTLEDCERVIKNLDGTLYSGRTMRVNMADRPKPKAPLYPEPEHKLFVGNLSWTVTPEMLTAAFQRCGTAVVPPAGGPGPPPRLRLRLLLHQGGDGPGHRDAQRNVRCLP